MPSKFLHKARLSEPLKATLVNLPLTTAVSLYIPFLVRFTVGTNVSFASYYDRFHLYLP